MTTHRCIGSPSPRGARVVRLVPAVLLAAALFAGPASAQDRADRFPSRDWDIQLFGGDDPDRATEHRGRDAFERGYRAGRQDERRGGSGSKFASGTAWNDAEQREERERLEHAAADLRHALVLMDRRTSGPRAERAVEQARQALIRTQNAMTWLPQRSGQGEERYERRSSRSIGPERASGGWEG